MAIGNLPDGWVMTTLGDVFKWGSGGTPLRGKSEYYDGDIPWVIIGDLNDSIVLETSSAITEEGLKNSSAKWVESGSILVAMYGSIGKLGIAGKRLTTNQAIAFTKAEPVNPKFLFYYLLGERNKLNSLGSGVAQKNISQTVLKAYPFPLAPLSEQERIVAKIEELLSQLESGTTALKLVQMGLKRYKDSLLTAACEGRLVSQNVSDETAEELLKKIYNDRYAKWKADLIATGNNAKYIDPVPIGDSSMPALPKGWTWASLDQIAQEGRPIIYGIIKPGPHIPNGIPYVRVTEMKDGFIDINKLRKTSIERAKKFVRATLEEGDLLISKDGTIGRVAVVPPELVGGNITQHVMRAPIHRFIDKRYIVWAIRSPFCQRWLKVETKGVALQGVNVEDFRRLPIPIPPIAEQVRIAEEMERQFTVTQKLEILLEKMLAHSIRLRQAVLIHAFEGRLVPQNPLDEPAEKLLERIKDSKMLREAQKNATPTKKKEKKMSTDKKRKPLYETLMAASGARLTPEQLFKASGFEIVFRDEYDNQAVFDAFYEELRSEIQLGRIKDERSIDKDIYLIGVNL
jgi:type I restriction enzyme S subunit